MVRATTTGVVLGSFTPPRPYQWFISVTAAADDRTFVLAAASRRTTPPQTLKPARFYRLTLLPSGKPDPLTALPIPPQAGNLNGLALSPEGSKLAVSLLTRGGGKDSMIKVFSLATGAERDWVWPGPEQIGWFNPVPQSLSWAHDDRTLLFPVHTPLQEDNGWTSGSPPTGAGSAISVRLLDTTAPGGNLLTASKLVPIPSRLIPVPAVGGQQGPPLLTGNATKVIAATARITTAGSSSTSAGRGSAATVRTNVTLTEFSARTGRPILVLYQHQFRGITGGPEMKWVNTSGNGLIVTHDVQPPGMAASNTRMLIGTQRGRSFTPLPTASWWGFTEPAAW